MFSKKTIVCASTLSDWIAVIVLDSFDCSGWIVMVQHARPAEGRRMTGSAFEIHLGAGRFDFVAPAGI